jgi:hypothetical protein
MANGPGSEDELGPVVSEDDLGPVVSEDDSLGPVVPEQPSVSPWQRTKQIAGIAGNTALGIGHFVGANVLPKVVGLGATGAKATGLASAVMAAPTVVKQAGDIIAGNKMASSMEALPEADFGALHAKAMEHLSADMSPDKAARLVTQFRNLVPQAAGHSDEDLLPYAQDYFARRYAQDIVQGNIQTTQSLSGDVSDAAHKLLADTAEGITSVGLGRVGAGAAEGTAKGVAETAAGGTGLGTVAQGMVKHGLSGAAFGAAFQGGQGATERALEAKGNGGDANDMFKAAADHLMPYTDPTTGAKEWGDLLSGAAFGGVLGAGVGGIAGGAGVAAGASEARTAKAAQMASSAAKIALGNFVDNFVPSDLLSKFSRTFSDAVQTGQTPQEAASALVAKLYPDVASSEEGMKAAATIAGRIGPWMEANAEHAPRFAVSPEAAAMAQQKAEAQAAAAQQAAQLGIQQGAAGLAPSPVEQVPGMLRPATSGLGQPLEMQNSAGQSMAPRVAPPPMAERGPAPQPLPPQEPMAAAPAPVAPSPQPAGSPEPLPIPGGPFQGRDVETHGQLDIPQRIGPGTTPPQVAPPGAASGSLTVPPDMIPGTHPPAVQGPYPTPPEPFRPPTPPPPVAEGVTHGNRPVPPAERAVDALRQGEPVSGTRHLVEGAHLQVSQSTGGGIEVEHLAGPRGAGESTKALQHVNAVADQTGVPVDMTVTDRQVKGGNLSASKQAEWAKQHGYEEVDKGDGWITLRREPKVANPIAPEAAAKLSDGLPAVAERVAGLAPERAVEAAGNVTEGKPLYGGSFGERADVKFRAIEEAAEKRLRKRLSGLGTSGISDPRVIGDLAISAAAKMFRLGLRSTRRISEALVQAHGELIKPYLDKAIARGRRLLEKYTATSAPTAQQLEDIHRHFAQGKVGMDWYDKTWDWLQKEYGPDAHMMARFLAATSAGASTEANAAFAMKAFAQWKLGLPFEGHLSKSIRSMLLKATMGQKFGDLKVQNYLAGLTGDPNAVALDRQVLRAVGFKNAGLEGGKSSLSPTQYAFYKAIIADAAQADGVTPRQYQAALWTSPKIEKVQAKVASGTKNVKTGSFRPMEQLLSKNYDGMAPMDWVEKNKVRFDQLHNASTATIYLRNGGLGGGITLDPNDYTEVRMPGHVVSLDSKNFPIGEITGSKIISFRNKFRSLIDEHPGTTIGIYDHGDGTGSIDFNVHLPSDQGAKALAVGKAGGQRAVGHFDESGNYTETPTGTKAKLPTGRTVKQLREQLKSL